MLELELDADIAQLRISKLWQMLQFCWRPDHGQLVTPINRSEKKTSKSRWIPVSIRSPSGSVGAQTSRSATFAVHPVPGLPVVTTAINISNLLNSYCAASVLLPRPAFLQRHRNTVKSTVQMKAICAPAARPRQIAVQANYAKKGPNSRIFWLF